MCTALIVLTLPVATSWLSRPSMLKSDPPCSRSLALIFRGVFPRTCPASGTRASPDIPTSRSLTVPRVQFPGAPNSRLSRAGSQESLLASCAWFRPRFSLCSKYFLRMKSYRSLRNRSRRYSSFPSGMWASKSSISDQKCVLGDKVTDSLPGSRSVIVKQAFPRRLAFSHRTIPVRSVRIAQRRSSFKLNGSWAPNQCNKQVHVCEMP